MMLFYKCMCFSKKVFKKKHALKKTMQMRCLSNYLESRYFVPDCFVTDKYYMVAVVLSLKLSPQVWLD